VKAGADRSTDRVLSRCPCSARSMSSVWSIGVGEFAQRVAPIAAEGRPGHEGER
jgi:hypothetical protein